MDALLKSGDVRTTDEEKTRFALIDVLKHILNCTDSAASKTLRRLEQKHPEVIAICGTFKFKGPGQRDTNVVDIRGLVTILNLMPGKRAAEFRAKSADILVRYLGGDETLIPEAEHPIQNAKNKAVIGFDGDTASFKKQHNIPAHAADADWMSRDQLDMRRIMSNKLKRTFDTMEEPTAKEMKRTVEEIGAKTSDMCEFMGVQGFNESQWSSRMRTLELQHATLEARTNLLEHGAKRMTDIMNKTT